MCPWQPNSGSGGLENFPEAAARLENFSRKRKIRKTEAQRGVGTSADYEAPLSRSRLNESAGVQAFGQASYEGISERRQEKQKISSHQTSHRVSVADDGNVRMPPDFHVNRVQNPETSGETAASTKGGALRDTNTLNNRGRNSLHEHRAGCKRENAESSKASSLWQKKMHIRKFRYQFREKEDIINEHFKRKCIEIEGEGLIDIASRILKYVLQKNEEAQEYALELFNEELGRLSPTEFSEEEGPIKGIVKAISQGFVKPAKLLIGLTYLMKMTNDGMMTHFSTLVEEYLLSEGQYSFIENHVLPMCVQWVKNQEP